MKLFDSGRKKETKKHKTPLENYPAHLDNIFQQEPGFYSTKTLIQALPGVTSIVYKDIPAKCHITALTYGLSLVNGIIRISTIIASQGRE